MEPIHCTSSDPNIAAVVAEHLNGFGGPAAIIANSEGRGVIGASNEGQGIWGQSVNSTGVVGISTAGFGVQAESQTGTASVGKSATGIGVHGVTTSASGVLGQSESGRGVHGTSQSSTGVNGESGSGFGVHGQSASNSGVLATSGSGIGLLASTDSGEAAVRGDHHGDGFAGVFNGRVLVTRDLHVRGDVQLVGADLAEEFGAEPADGLEPGCVMVLTGDDSVRMSDRPYDGRVAGVISGAGGYRPGMVLDRRVDEGRWPLALVGKVWCKVDADHGSIGLGDLLTTSPTPGHAMRADDQARSFGAVLGKALADVPAGRTLIPVLVTLQ